MDLDKKEESIILFSFYSGLLPKKSFDYFDLYYNQDYSLSEIASFFKVTRTAIFDSLRKTLKILHFYEEKLGLVSKSNKRNQILNNLNKDNLEESISLLKEIEND